MAALSRPQARRAETGFTMVEMVVTLGILAVGLLAMLLLQARALSDGSRGRHATAAAMIAQDQIELVTSLPFGSPSLTPVGWSNPPWIDNSGDPDLADGEIPVRVALPGGAANEQIYTVWYRVLTHANADLLNVDVEVTWNEADISNNRPTRTGQPTVAVSSILVNNDR